MSRSEHAGPVTPPRAAGWMIVPARQNDVHHPACHCALPHEQHGRRSSLQFIRQRIDKFAKIGHLVAYLRGDITVQKVRVKPATQNSTNAITVSAGTTDRLPDNPRKTSVSDAKYRKNGSLQYGPRDLSFAVVILFPLPDAEQVGPRLSVMDGGQPPAGASSTKHMVSPLDR